MFNRLATRENGGGAARRIGSGYRFKVHNVSHACANTSYCAVRGCGVIQRAIYLISRARRILRAHVYCARRKEGRGKNTSGVFGQVFVCTAGMLAVPIRLQYRVININNT